MQGYVDKARSRPEMFPPNRIDVVFSNIGDIFRFSTHLLADLESALDVEQPHASQIGHVFLKHVRRTFGSMCCISLTLYVLLVLTARRIRDLLALLQQPPCSR